MKRLDDIKLLTNVSIVLDEKHIKDLVDLIDEFDNNDELGSFLEGVDESNISPAEAFLMAKTIAERGRSFQLSERIGECITRASIGDISDSVSLVVMSVLGELGEKVVKLTSSEYGKFTNTISRMKLFQGFDADVSDSEFLDIIEKCGVGILENNGSIAPIDKNLRKYMSKFPEPSIPLLAVSMLSKKIALGVSTVVYDVKVGEGGIVKDKATGYKLAEYLVEATKLAGMKTACVVTTLNQPVSASIGSMLELREVVKTLSSGSSYFGSDLVAVSREICEIALILTGRASGRVEAGEMFDECIMSGKALLKLKEIVEAFGGDFEVVNKDMNIVSRIASSYIESEDDGYLVDIDSMGLYSASHILRAGIEDENGDENSGIVMLAREGEKVSIGQKLARISYGFENMNFTRALKLVSDSLKVKMVNTKHEKLLIKVFV